ncbi:hypothetical protein T265_12474, partial [Opisthorchis viverrini]
NVLLIRLLKIRRQPTTGFALLGAHQQTEIQLSLSTECAARRPLHVSVDTTCEVSQYIFMRETTRKVGEIT